MTRPSLESPARLCSPGQRRGTTALGLVMALSGLLSILMAVALARLPHDDRCVFALAESLADMCPQPGGWQGVLADLRWSLHDGWDGCASALCPASVEWWGESLSADDAEQLATNTATIFIRRATRLDRDAARWLGHSAATLVFDAVDGLRGDTAACLAGHAAGIRLDAMTTLHADAARALAGCRGPLWLNGLRTIDADVARELASHRGHLSLNGLEHLDAEVAALLAMHDGELCLNGLASLTTSVAAALAHHRHRLNLNGVVALDDDVAEALGSFRGLALSLDNAAIVSDRAAAALRRLRQCSLFQLHLLHTEEGRRTRP